MDRREFLMASAAATATGFLAGCSTANARRISANGKINHACIGVGGMGYNDLQNLKSHPRAQIVAICDVDKNHLDKAAALLPNARRYTDWREKDRIVVGVYRDKQTSTKRRAVKGR